MAASRADTGIIYLFYHMKMTFEKEMLLLNGVIDLVETFTEEETVWLGDLSTPYD